MYLSFTRLIALTGVLCLTACATATRGSKTIFAVSSNPDGAFVTTDLKLPDRKIEFDEDGNITAEYYGCAPTPCGFELPRRSDFNVMIVLLGYQPFTHVVVKDRSRKQTKANEKVAVGTVAAGSAYGGASAAVASSSGGFGVLAIPAVALVSTGIIAAVPVAGVFTGVDFATGALIDLKPNPLNVELKPQVSEEETEALITAFVNSRRIHSDER